LTFSPNGKLLADGNYDGTVRLFDSATGLPVGAVIQAASTGPYAAGVWDVAFSPDGKLLASADGDGTVRLWNPATTLPVGAPLQATSPNGYVAGVAFSPDSKVLASADNDGTVKFWEVAASSDPYRALCADVGPPTTSVWHQYAPGEADIKICA
jgi:WD40 repeat protein